MRVVENYIPKGANNPDRPIKPDMIVIHYSGGACVSAETLARCLVNNNAKDVSANYCVDEKDIICTIPPGYMSYGVLGHNEHIINIETCFKDPAGRFELDTIANLRRVVKKCMRDFDITEKKCPWYYVVNPKEWTRLHRMITKGVVL